ncbi:hypothetical protein E3N88_34447 [Mikania micrantha]|uniref:Uncharacterized protein n=1 Tax=Mikania micrantha TaxID=192012 RepID=A0A5N6LY55_9ASTR|nr:hypothetical protein E3N88_34447 [Mikania micrantha]
MLDIIVGQPEPNVKERGCSRKGCPKLTRDEGCHGVGAHRRRDELSWWSSVELERGVCRNPAVKEADDRMGRKLRSVRGDRKSRR